LNGTLVSEGAVFSARTIFKEYQFRPLVKYLKSIERRILIADEPGLGKTIEAGYIMAEELARAKLPRILVLCPSGLRRKWQQEMWSRFGLSFEVIRGSTLRSLLLSEKSFRAIASFDSLRRKPDLFGELGRLGPIDLLIIDEVHHMIGRGEEILRREIGFALSQRSRRVIALSATPVQIEFLDLRRVLEIVLGRNIDALEFARDIELTRALNRILVAAKASGSVGNSDLNALIRSLRKYGVTASEISDLENLVARASSESAVNHAQAIQSLSEKLESISPFGKIMIRNRKKDVGELRERIVTNHEVQLSVATEIGYQHGEEVTVSEQSMFEEVDSLLQSSFTHVHRLQLASCLHAMIDLLRGGMRGFPVWQKGSQILGPLDLLDSENPDEYEAVKRTLTAAEIDTCRHLVDKYGLLAVDSKWDELLKILSAVREGATCRKVIVFTQWIPTLRYLSRRANRIEGFKCFEISGEESPWHINESLKGFQEWQESAVLFTTDILSEGRDLQQASILVNYDFPYNPQRVEQRIGRIDRIGQKADSIEIHNLWVKGSIDEQIMGVLRDRLNIFQEALGDVSDIFEAGSPEDALLKLARREERRLAARKELDDSGIFLGVEDFLDKNVRELRAKRSGYLTHLLWVAIRHALTLCTGQNARVNEGADSVNIGPFTNGDVGLIRQWAGTRDAQRIATEIESNLDKQGNVRLAKRPGVGGLFIPVSHPLAELSIGVSLNSFERLGTIQRPLILCESRKVEGWQERIVICKQILESDRRHVHRLRHWAERHDGSVRQLLNSELMEFQDWLERAELLDISEEQSWTESQSLAEHVSQDLGEWLRQQQRESAPSAPSEVQDPISPDRDELSSSQEYLAVVYRRSPV
jgi:superfamily II DNA or RNA helicase